MLGFSGEMVVVLDELLYIPLIFPVWNQHFSQNNNHYQCNAGHFFLTKAAAGREQGGGREGAKTLVNYQELQRYSEE
jgi:hypothetical protein